MHKLVAIAGTFDRLHKGHRWFISQAFSFGNKVLIGLTSDSFVKEKFQISNSKFQINSKIQIQNFQTRKKELIDFLREAGYLTRSSITKIDDVYGPAVENNEIEVLVVTSDTLEGARLVNKKRRTLGLIPLKILQIPLVLAEDHKRIASTRIRLGEIDRYGKVYLSKIPGLARHGAGKRQNAKVKSEVRLRLKKPLGILIKGDSKVPQEIAPEIKKLVKEKSPVIIITVGDVATKLCNEIGIPLQLAVIDFKVERVKLYSSLSDLGFLSLAGAALASVRNPAGYITASLVSAVNNALKNLVTTGKPQIITVDGEEDLAGVPAILLAPLGSLVFYGQPGEGIVAVEVTEEKKEKLLEVIIK